MATQDHPQHLFDKEIIAISDYVCYENIKNKEVYHTAYYDLLDTLACGFEALSFSECTKLLGPIVTGAILPDGARVPGTRYELDPVQAAFNIGTMIRWLDYNDTWLAAEWGHPSDNLGGILAVSDYLSRQRVNAKPITVHDLLTSLIKAHEIQGILALENSFNRIGLDHVVYVKVATTAIVTYLLGGNHDIICNALSLAWIDGHSLRTYRHAPNTGSRKSWAAGDATSRGVRLALMAMKGEMGCPTALSAKKWGLYDVYFAGKPFSFPQPYQSYVMENILFKVAFPAEFHAQTAVECAFILHLEIKNRLNEIDKIIIHTQEPAVRIIHKTGKLYNPADRDHCLQYMVAIGLIFGELTAKHYEENTAQDPRIDFLRNKMEIIEDPQFTHDYYDPNKRSIGNAIQIFFINGEKTEKITTEYPIGHRQRREEAKPLLIKKFKHSVSHHFDREQSENIIETFLNEDKLMRMSVDKMMDLIVK